MTQEEKISLLEKIRLDYAFLGTPSFDVLTNAIDALLSPWVKTADRLPDKCEYYTMYLTTKKRNGGVWQVRGSFIKEHPELCPWWMPIPPFPEVEE